MRAAAVPAGLARAVGGAFRTTASLIPARARRWLLAGALLLTLVAAGYFAWLRDSSLVAVEEVSVTGLTTRDAPEIKAALSEAARDMTTLHVDVSRLERAVSGYAAVARVEADADLPHRLAIEVVERTPIAVVEGPGGGDVPVAADGTLVPDIEPAGALARLEGSEKSSAGRVRDPEARATLAAVSAAPAALARRIELVEEDDGELLVTLEEGPAVLLGDASDLDAKWAAAAATLAEDEVAGAGYLDVSLPARPVVGG